jgi:16S rRNA (cytosine967-C5)-methyltransferase
MHLLTELWKVLKPGGILLYVTCSVLPEENGLLIQKFLNNHADAQLIPLTSVYGFDAKPGLQILPSVEGPDGFYYAKLSKLYSSGDSYAAQ